MAPMIDLAIAVAVMAVASMLLGLCALAIGALFARAVLGLAGIDNQGDAGR